MRTKIVALATLGLHLLFLASGCGGAMAPPEAATPSAEAAAPPAPPPPPPGAALALGGVPDDARLAMLGPPPAPAPASPSATSAQTAPPAQAVAVRAPILIYTAQITMAVFEVNASLAKVEAVGRELGGFLAKRDDMSITIRVPIAVFDEAVKRVEGVGDMLHRNITAEDVTAEYVDLEVRLKSARAVQARLTELLTKAVKVEESIAIEKELDRVSGEIERIEGRMKFLRDRAAFSTITVRFEPKRVEQVGTQRVHIPVPWLDEVNLPRLLKL